MPSLRVRVDAVPPEPGLVTCFVWVLACLGDLLVVHFYVFASVDVWMFLLFDDGCKHLFCFSVSFFFLFLLASQSQCYTHPQLEICKRVRFEQEQSGQKMLLDVRLNDDLVLVHAAVSL